MVGEPLCMARSLSAADHSVVNFGEAGRVVTAIAVVYGALFERRRPLGCKFRRDGRVVEGAPLLREYRLKRLIEGSNPSLSASLI